MAELNVAINPFNSIVVSRNTPVALVVGVAGFLGSHLAEELILKGIQVIGVDNFSTGEKKNLEELVKNKKFHLINQSIENPLSLKLPRLDYALWSVDSIEPNKSWILKKGLHNFLIFCSEFKPKFVLVSSISLYTGKLPHNLICYREVEINFARFVKDHKLNGRVIRLSSLYGPRMHFREADPMIRLIQASLLGDLQSEQTSLDFSSRSLFIKDAVSLLIKSIFSGSTAHKIYDGALPQPIKVSEIKQILLDPLWYEKKGILLTELPPWVTPNLRKSLRELSWKPKSGLVQSLKETISYFKDRGIDIPKVEESLEHPKAVEARQWLRGEQGTGEDRVPIKASPGKVSKISQFLLDKKASIRWGALLGGMIILLGLIYPILSLVIGAFSIRFELKASQEALQAGDFKQATSTISRANSAVSDLQGLINSFGLLNRIGLTNPTLASFQELTSVAKEGVEGVAHATLGAEALFKTTKTISGEDSSDPRELYSKANIELATASEELEEVKAKLTDQNFLNNFPVFLRGRLDDFNTKLSFYTDLVIKARAAAAVLPQITAVDSRKSYLVLLQNNLELRPGGGFIGSFAKLDFEKGRLVKLNVDDIYNLDGNLHDHIEPPPEIKSDLGQNDYYLRDSNFEPDFPSDARLAEFFYNKEAGERVNGVVALDLSASAKLLEAVGGLDLSDYGEHVDQNNLFEKAISHAEVNFFPGSQAKRNYLTALESELFQKIFFLSKQNWPAIIQALSQSLDEKHLVVYLDDPTLFSYLNSQNWTDSLPRQKDNPSGETLDFLASIDANLGANKTNYYLQRSFELETSLGKEGLIFHHLKITFKNNSPSEVFPAGKYKNRFRIYLPLGTKLTKASFGDDDIISKLTSYSDYGRSVYSIALIVNPKETKTLTLDYQPAKPLNFADGRVSYRLDIFKEAGTLSDPFNFHFSYPINFKVTSALVSQTKNTQQLDLISDLSKDRSFLIELSK